MFLGCSEIKIKPTANPLHMSLGSLEKLFLISTDLGQGAACANKTFCRQVKSSG